MEITPLSLIVPDFYTGPNLQAAVNQANLTPKAAVWIPANYSGSDTYSNPSSVPVFDMRSGGSISFTSAATFASLAGGINTSAAMVIGTGASLTATGSGSIIASNGITLVSSIPATCTPGTTAAINLTTAPYGLYNCVGTNQWARASTPTNVIDPTAFGAKFDGKIAYGNTSSIVMTSGSPTVTCSTCNFTSADVGKQFTATSGGLGGVSAAYQGVFAVPNSSTTILAVVNSTTITLSQNASASCTTGCQIVWATNDDPAFDAAEAAWQALPTCGTIALPAGLTAVLKAHFNNPGTGCNNQTTSIDFDASVIGQGMGVTQIGLFAGFDPTTCTGGGGSDICFFGFTQAIISNLQINGFGAGNTTFGSAKKIMGPGLGSQVSDLSCEGYGGSDANVTGFSFDGVGVRAKFLSIDGCGKRGGLVNGTIAKCYYCFFGDTLGVNLEVGGTGELNDYGSDYGSSGGTIVIRVDGVYRGFGSNLFSCGAANATAIYAGNGNSNTVVDLIGSKFNCGTTTSNGYFGCTGCKLKLSGGTIIGGTTSAINRNGATVYTAPDTVFAAGAITSIAPTCAFTSGGGTSPSCALQAGSTNEKGVVIATTGSGSPGSVGTLTLTFAGTYTGPSGAAPACTYTLDDSATAWGDGAVVRASTQSTTAPLIAWSNYANSTGVATLAILATASAFRIGYTCTAR